MLLNSITYTTEQLVKECDEVIASYVKNISRLLAVLVLTMAMGCSRNTGEVIAGKNWEFEVPENFPEPVYPFRYNPVTREGFELGKKIFFDPVLSRDQTVSCSSCHSQSVAFADPQHRLSVGVDEQIGKRNAPQIANLAFQSSFFWDGGVTQMDFIPLNAIENEFEMDNNMSVIADRMRNTPAYPPLFDAAFGGDTINSGRILHALSQFMSMMVSADSKYDRYVRQEGAGFTQDEIDGMKLFELKCGGCHGGVLFTSMGFENNGIDSAFGHDPGRFLITGDSSDLGKFKVPGLRNVAITGPYMHDGRFASLEEVLEHYASGVRDSGTLSEILKQDGKPGLVLSNAEKLQIIKFLKTLTDESFINDPRFQNR